MQYLHQLERVGYPFAAIFTLIFPRVFDCTDLDIFEAENPVVAMADLFSRSGFGVVVFPVRC